MKLNLRGLQGPLFELLKMVVIVFGIFALLHLLKQYYEPMVDFENIQGYDSQKSQYQIAPPQNTFQEGAAVPELDNAALESIVVGDDTLRAEELLPTYTDANEFAKENPVSELLKQQSFLVSGYSIGVNTTSQSSKIPNLYLRAAPPIPKGDWPINNSSLDRSNSFQRREMNIGS